MYRRRPAGSPTDQSWAAIPPLDLGDGECPPEGFGFDHTFCAYAAADPVVFVGTISSRTATWAPATASDGEVYDLTQCIYVVPVIDVVVEVDEVARGPELPSRVNVRFRSHVVSGWLTLVRQPAQSEVRFSGETDYLSLNDKVLISGFMSGDRLFMLNLSAPFVTDGIVTIPDVHQSCYPDPLDGQSLPINEYLARVAACEDTAHVSERDPRSASPT